MYIVTKLAFSPSLPLSRFRKQQNQGNIESTHPHSVESTHPHSVESSRSAAYSSGLPPLAPVQAPHHNAQRRPSETNQVPSQIHLMDEEETLTSEVTDRGMGDMKKVNSMEKLGKLKGQMTVSLRRFRSWSMSGTTENPVGSIDSTQKETLSKNTEAHHHSSTTIQEPYLDDGELKPLIYGYLHKLGRNGHWQKRFFETNGRSLTYYKNQKRSKILATLDLCKVRLFFKCV